MIIRYSLSSRESRLIDASGANSSRMSSSHDHRTATRHRTRYPRRREQQFDFVRKTRLVCNHCRRTDRTHGRPKPPDGWIAGSKSRSNSSRLAEHAPASEFAKTEPIQECRVNAECTRISVMSDREIVPLRATGTSLSCAELARNERPLDHNSPFRSTTRL